MNLILITQNWRRTPFLVETLKLIRQEDSSIPIYVWNNTPQDSDKFDGLDVKIFESDENNLIGRYEIVIEDECDCRSVLFFDDDIRFNMKAVEKLYDRHVNGKSEDIVGGYGRIFAEGNRPYTLSTPIPFHGRDCEVDYLGSNFLMFYTPYFPNSFWEIPEKWLPAYDIYHEWKAKELFRSRLWHVNLGKDVWNISECVRDGNGIYDVFYQTWRTS